MSKSKDIFWSANSFHGERGVNAHTDYDRKSFRRCMGGGGMRVVARQESSEGQGSQRMFMHMVAVKVI